MPKDVQSLKASVPIDVTESENFMTARPEHQQKALSPILTNDLPNVTEYNDLQKVNELASIAVTLSPITKEVIS